MVSLGIVLEVDRSQLFLKGVLCDLILPWSLNH